MKLLQKLNSNRIHATEKRVCEVTQVWVFFITTPSASLIHSWGRRSFAHPAALPDRDSLPQQGIGVCTGLGPHTCLFIPESNKPTDVANNVENGVQVTRMFPSIVFGRRMFS